MKYGVRFCGGCNPRYERGAALKKIKDHFGEQVDFEIAREDDDYDGLLIIGGCSNCCPDVKHYKVKTKPLKMWEEKHTNEVIGKIKKEVDVT